MQSKLLIDFINTFTGHHNQQHIIKNHSHYITQMSMQLLTYAFIMKTYRRFIDHLLMGSIYIKPAQGLHRYPWSF